MEGRRRGILPGAGGRGAELSRVSFSFVNSCLPSPHSSSLPKKELECVGEFGVRKDLGRDP